MTFIDQMCPPFGDYNQCPTMPGSDFVSWCDKNYQDQGNYNGVYICHNADLNNKKLKSYTFQVMACKKST
jgi:hypothetical protein